MKIVRLLFVALLLSSGELSAADYIVDFTRVEDFESIRPLVTGCEDFSAMEFYRERMEAAKNLEDMRDVFVRTGLGMFNDCSDGITGPGIALVE